MEQLDPQVVALAKAIRQAESGGNFTARSKDGSFGAYQFIKPTWDSTAKKYGVATAWEKATPQEQNKVAYMQLKEWKDKGYNVGQIASMWNAGAGRPDAYLTGLKGTNKDGVNYNVTKYATKVRDFYQQYKNGTQTPTVTPAQSQNQTLSDRVLRQQQGLPVSVDENRSQLTVGGEILRGIIRPFVRAVNTPIEGIRKLTGEKNIDTYSEYLGDVSGFGMKEGQTTKQRVRDVAGGALEIGSSLVPVGKAATLASRVLNVTKPLAKTAIKAGIGAGVGYGFDAGVGLQDQNQTIGQALEPGAGTLTGGLFAPIAAGTGAVLRGVAGKTSGVGSGVLQRAFDNPKAVETAVRTFAKSPEAKKELVDTAGAAISRYLSARGTQFSDDIGKLTSKVGFQGKKLVTESFENALSTFGGKIKNGNIVFTDTTLSKADQNVLKQALATINKWKNTSVVGMDKLRQALNNVADDYKQIGGSRANVVIGRVETDIKNNLEKTVPGYKQILKTYGQKTYTAKQLAKELSQGGQAKETTQINQIMRLFKKDPEVLKKLSEVMGKSEAEAFLDEIAGAILSEWAPRGWLGNIGRGVLSGGLTAGAIFGGSGALGLAAGAGATASSPRIVGKAARLFGNAKKTGINNALRKTTSLGGAATE